MALLTANEVILDRTIRRNALLEQYKTQEVQDLVTFLNLEVEPDLIAQLQRLDLDALTRRNLLDLRNHVRKVMEEGYAEIKNRLQADMLSFAQADAAWQLGVMATAIPLAIDLTSPSIPTIREMLRSRPIDGVMVGETFKALSPVAAARVNQQIMLGIVQGEGISRIVDRIRGTRMNLYGDGVLDMARRDLATAVRTAVAGVSNNVRQVTFEANTDVIKAVMWVSTLDTRTCDSCGSLDGVTFDVFSGRRPPLHPACRCTMTPITKSWKELGFNLPEMPESTRVSMNGQVPRSLKYPAWLRAQNDQTQDQILGKRKAGLFRSGRMALSQFVIDKGRTLTLAELGART